MRTILKAEDLVKVYRIGKVDVHALRGVSLEVQEGEFVAIMGPSGSGKSTLMHCLAGLDTVSKGEVWIGDTKVTGLSDAKLTKLRRDKVGFIFQQFNLLPTLTAEENITLPLSIAGRKVDKNWFDTVVDSALFHVFGTEDRLAYARSLHGVTRPGAVVHVLALADVEPAIGPVVSDEAFTEAFGAGWRLEGVRPSSYRGVARGVHAELFGVGEGALIDVPAWLATATRL